MKLKWTDTARHQARVIVGEISADNPAAALRWVAKLDDLLDTVARFPFSGHVAEGFNQDSVREIRHGKYRVFYEVAGDTVFIQSIWHGARRPPGRGVADAPDDE